MRIAAIILKENRTRANKLLWSPSATAATRMLWNYVYRIAPFRERSIKESITLGRGERMR